MQETTCSIPRRTTPEPEEIVVPANLENVALATEVACCIAEIDAALARVAEDEKLRAAAEFEELRTRFIRARSAAAESAASSALRVWQAQYAHLGLKVHWCCGVPNLIYAPE